MKNYPPPIFDRKIRFALVGCGRIASNHFAAIKQYPDQIELVAICDTDHEALIRAAETTNAQPFTNLSEMLERIDIDIVVIATPSGLHPQQAIQIAKTGRHIMTEKPMATRWRDGKNMVQACDEASVRLFVVKQNRRNATMQLLKQAIVQQRFGRIYMVNINVFWTRPQSYYDSSEWRGTWEFDGGAFMNQASHYVDLLHWLLGPVQSVGAMMGTLARQIEVEDTGVMNLRWRHGAMGTVNVTTLTYPEDKEGSLTILGEKGSVRFAGKALNRLEWWQFSEPHEMDALVHE